MVYKFTWPATDSQHNQIYIACTSTTAKRRIPTHAQNCSILTHDRNAHELKTKTHQLLENIKKIYKLPKNAYLILAETFLNIDLSPTQNSKKEEKTHIWEIF